MRRDVPRREFRGRDLAAVSARARLALGDDAVILNTRTLASGDIEVIAADADDVARFERRLTASGTCRALINQGPTAGRPFVLALVGPTGAGKTTTAVKLAVHPDAFGTRRVGFLTLDTWRAGAVAQIEAYARVAGIPLEVAYDARDAAGALARLAHCDAVIVDTPGRGPRAGAEADGWREAFGALAPDEVHLALPATARPDVAEAVRESLDAPPAPATHLLLTKLDEVPGEAGVADLAALVDLPARWVCDGQAIPADLAPAVPRIVRALGAFGSAGALGVAPSPRLPIAV